MNVNYAKGVRFERERLKHYKEVMKFDAVRTAGSHGTWDIIATDWPRGLCHHIQCKVVSSRAACDRLLRQFQEAPPFNPVAKCYQILEVKISGSTEVHSVTV